MSYRQLRLFCCTAAVLVFLSQAAWAQQVSASLSGVVKDNQGAVIPGARIVVLNQAQGAVARELQSEGDGSFVVFPLIPSVYTLTIEAPGFKKFEQKDIKLFANDRLTLPSLVLEVGPVTETIVVTSEPVQLQLESAERSGIVTGHQTVNLALNGRNYLSLTALIPGILSTATNDVAGPGGIGSIFANGQRGVANSVTLDGATNMDTGANGTQLTSLNIDAVAEFRVLTNSQPAEFGRVAGATINVVTKSGGRDFHGTGYWFHRHEGLNANNWRNNKDGLPRSLYRYNYQGYNIGGPVYIPGKFNANKEKLFFFWAQEWQEQLLPQATRNATVPTEAERNGDSSLTHESDGRPVVIRDPLTGMPFPHNRIAANRWDANGHKILKYLPLPNVAGQNAYNFQPQVSAGYPRRQELARVDWNVNQKWKIFLRAILDEDTQEAPYGQWASATNIPLGPVAFKQPGKAGIINVTTVLNPTLTNEFIFGPGRNRLTILPTTDGQNASKMGLDVRMPFPSANALNLVPGLNFGGVPNAPNFNLNNIPFYNVNNTFDFTDNVMKVIASHQVKFGFYIQRSRKDQTSESPINGLFFFDRDPANPGDTNWAFSNALLGNFQRFQQSNTLLNSRLRYTDVEWYVQDIWKVRPNLTINAGIRFYVQQPQCDVLNRGASFNAAFHDPSKAALLYPGVRDSSGGIVAQDPLTGQLLPAVFIGGLVPNVGKWQGGAYVNGIARAGEGYFRGTIRNRGVHYAPRFGLAWNVKPKTVFRAGAGVFYDRIYGTGGVGNPPALIQPIVYYGNIAALGSSSGTLFPQGLSGFSPDGHLPTTYNWNAGFQHVLPYKLVADVAYVGSVSRHQVHTLNINGMPFGSAWLPQNQDPTLGTPRFDGTTTLPINYIRPYRGYGDINIQGMGAISNYNALQASLSRRLTEGLQLGVAYTWSKALGTAGATGDSVNPVNMRKANYGPLSFDRRHMLVINYIYDVPKLAKNNFLDNPLGRAVVNNWQVSGITSFVSGQPDSIGYSVSGVSDLNRRITGSDTWGPRIVVKGNPNLDKGSRAVDAFINTSVFAPAAVGSLGMESAQRIITRPGINNWDLSVFKNFPFTKETPRYLPLRVELFNAWNHTQFSDFNRSATFNPTTGAISNVPASRGGGGGTYGFGAINAARNPRIITACGQDLLLRLRWSARRPACRLVQCPLDGHGSLVCSRFSNLRRGG